MKVWVPTCCAGRALPRTPSRTRAEKPQQFNQEAGMHMKKVLVVLSVCTPLTHSFHFDRQRLEKQCWMVAVCCPQPWRRHSKVDHTSFCCHIKADSGKQPRCKKVFLVAAWCCLRSSYVLACPPHPFVWFT